MSPLQAAMREQRVSIALRLINHPDIDINYLGEGPFRRTPLQCAVDKGNMELVNIVLDHGVDVNGPPATVAGATALQLAAIHGFLLIAQKLINKNVDVNAAEGAAEHGRIDMLQFLLGSGASIEGDEGERQYQRAVELAKKNGHNAAAKLLMSAKS
ncbi:ankyrin [Aspergillus cavernicola]|uniref:Ankyrin n=1 Tax=Aspergillus cavernicola TaxID=176166 RepID=A0ABR4I975_9EURO